ncbi:hypothetical protein B0T13DRAFT_461890 [Neurospora crassa]|nr:hypothetical protein B0T13DRAFT_461890 [Neurospora crassa]
MVAGSLVISEDQSVSRSISQSGRSSNREEESKDDESEQLNGKFADTMLTKLVCARKLLWEATAVVRTGTRAV